MEIIEKIYEAQKNYHYIKSINISRTVFGAECSDFDLRITLCTLPSWDDTDDFSIVFQQVKNLKIGDIDNLFCVCFDIQSVSHWQQEGIHYAVQELENELFSFLCRDIVLS